MSWATMIQSIVCLMALLSIAGAKCIMYLTGQHDVVPEQHLVSDITHVTLAFMRSSTFNYPGTTEWPFFTTVEKVRSQFANGTAVMVAIGGWGDPGFDQAARTQASRELFAENVKAMVEATGADGVDIDWEYPGGNGDDYKVVPNLEKAWEIEAYPKLLAEVRAALGPDKVISAAVPGLPRDMIAFTKTTIPLINKSLDFFNIMTYDLMNRRDNITKHHTGVTLSMAAINEYIKNGVPPEKANLGFAFYLKYFKTDPHGGCDRNPIGCKTTLMEDPTTGADLGQTGGFSWHDNVPEDVVMAFDVAMHNGRYDSDSGGHYFWDSERNLWWTWDTPKAIARKFPEIVEEKKLGGVFAWGLGEDAPNFRHLKALTSAYRKHTRKLAAGEKGYQHTGPSYHRVEL